MATEQFDLRCTINVATAGHEVVTTAAIGEDQEVRFLTPKLPQPGRPPFRRYDPFAQETGLFRTFAATALDEEVKSEICWII